MISECPVLVSPSFGETGAGILILTRLSSGSNNVHASRYPSHLYRSGCFGFIGSNVTAFFFFRNKTAAGIKYQTSSGIT